MDEAKIILVYGGFWDRSLYKNGEEVLVFTSLWTLSLKEFLDDVHNIVRADRIIYDYVLACLIPTEDCGVVKSRIRSDRDLQRVPRMFKTPKIFVTIEPKHRGIDASFYGSQSFSQWGIHKARHNSFVHLLASQGPYNSPFAHGMMHCPVPYLSAPYVHGTGPGPYIHGARPDSAPVVHQLGPSIAAIAKQPCLLNKALKVGQPWTPSASVDVPQVKDKSERMDECSLRGKCYCSYNHGSLCSCYRSVHNCDTSSISRTSATARCYCNWDHQSLCSDCFRSLHNCDVAIATSDSVDNEVTQPITMTQSKPRRCGICREVGHTRRTCPMQNY